MNPGTSPITYATRIRALLASAGLMSPSRSPAHVHNWEKSRFRRNVFEGRSRPGEVCCSEVDVRAQQVRSRLSLSLSLSLSLLSFSFWTRSRSASITPRDFRRRGSERQWWPQRAVQLSFADREASTSEIRPRHAPRLASPRVASCRDALARTHARSCTDLETAVTRAPEAKRPF